MVRKLIPALLLAGFLGLVLTRPPAHLSTGPSDASESPEDPASHPMACHLNAAHGVQIASSTDADIRVVREGDYIVVEFKPEFLERLREDALTVLELQESRTYMSESRYSAFLFMLHAYLAIAPAETSPDRTYVTHGHD